VSRQRCFRSVILALTLGTVGCASVPANRIAVAEARANPADKKCQSATPGQFVVRLKSAQDKGPFLDAFAKFLTGVTTPEPVPEAIELNPTLFLIRNAPDGVRTFLDGDRGVAAYDENALITLFKTPPDNDFNQQCGLTAIHAEQAWDYADPALAGAVRVALVDSGIAKHNDLPTTGPDKDGDGHGTHIAGIIGARQDGAGIVGVVWKVNLFGYDFVKKGGDLAHALDQLDRALDAKDDKNDPIPPNIVVMAWGGPCRSELLEQTIDAHPDVLFVASAGNSPVDLGTFPVYPAVIRRDNLISVMATRCDNLAAPFTSYSRTLVDIAAPGAAASNAPACAGACPGNYGIYSTVLNSRYCCEMGTSMSAGYVAGAAALVWSHQTSPTAKGVKQCLVDSAGRLDVLKTMCASGLLDLESAVNGSHPASCN